MISKIKYDERIHKVWIDTESNSTSKQIIQGSSNKNRSKKGKIEVTEPQKRAVEVIRTCNTPKLEIEENKNLMGIQQSDGMYYLEGYQYPIYSRNIIPMSWAEPRPLLQGYSEFYKTELLEKYAERLWITIGKISSYGLRGINPDIHKRISGLSLLHMMKEDDYIKLTLPLVYEGNFEMIDEFRWFTHDKEVKAKFQCIYKICELMVRNMELSCKKFKNFADSPKIHLTNLNSGTVNKVKSITEDQQKGSTITVVNHGEYDHNDIKDRLEIKHLALTQFEKMKEPILQKLETDLQIFQGYIGYINKLHPNKIQAYLIFELMLNQALRITHFVALYKESPFFEAAFQEKLQSTFAFAHFVELLLPYAQEVTKRCGIDLENNPLLLQVRKYKRIHNEKLHEEYRLYEECMNESFSSEEEIFSEKKVSKKAVRANDKGNDAGVEKVEGGIDEKSIIEPSLEEKEIAKNKAETEAFSLARKLASKEADKMRKMAREEKKASKEKAEKTAKSQKAENMYSEHKAEEAEKEQKIQKERLNSQMKIHDLPSIEFVQKEIIAQLKGDHLKHFEMLFEIIENDKVMTYENIKNLTKHIKEILVINNIGCADDLKREVKMREHHRHNKDTGKLLPKFYVSILRTCFVIFGIFPKNWEPQTKGDIKAMIKYNSRLMDKLMFEIQK